MIWINTNLLTWVIIALLVMWLLHRAVNPHDLNHLVLINESGQQIDGFTLSLEGSGADWSTELTGCGEARLRVYNVADAFFTGTLVMRVEGEEWLAVPIRPPGRYCGALVVRYSGGGEYEAAWNRLR